MRAPFTSLMLLLVTGSTACRSTPRAARNESEQIAAAQRTGVENWGDARLAATTATTDALDAATARAVGWRNLAIPANWRETIDPDRAPVSSLSYGSVANGTLLNSVEMKPTGEFHSIIERHRKYKTRWGTAELVDLIQAGAQHVHVTESGAPLRLGNMSKKKGGDIRWSRSHNSGRDADIAFYVVATDSNESVPAPDLLRFDEHGVPAGREDLRFDVARNWRFVEALLSQTAINVQWIFVSIPLKEMLLAHARSIGVDDAVIARADQVLHQPTDSRPHADHFHLRIGCSEDDRLDGCLDYGPQWDWLDWHRTALLAQSLSLSRAFTEGSPADRIRTLEFLAEIQSPFAADIAGVWGLWDEDESVRKLALDVANNQHGWSATALVEIRRYITQQGRTDRELRKAYRVLRRSRDPLARTFALRRLADKTNSPAERAYAASSLTHFAEPEVVPPLIAAIADPAPPVRAAAARVLRRIANRSEEIDWERADEKKRQAAHARWQTWWEANRASTRDSWLAHGFAETGLSVGDNVGPKDIDDLVKLLTSKHDYLRYNANRTIRELTGRWAPLEQEDGKALLKYWKKWWKKNRERVLSGEIGPKT